MVVAPGAEQVEGGEAAPIDHDGFPINEAGAHRQVSDRRYDARESVGEVGTVAGVKPHPIAIAAGQDAEVVVLDFMDPAGADRGSLAGLGRQGAISLASFSPSKMRATAGVARCLRLNTISNPCSTSCLRTR
jgi:hypothetical protein